MPAFLVHGVPDTHHLWDGVREHLDRSDVIAPDLPGFASPVPEGFDCTMDAYATWLIAEVEAAGEPVDIVGHDWGSLLVQRLVSLRPDLVRTWCAGGAVIDAKYEWHPTAKIWQTPGAGEQFMQQMTPEAMAGALAVQGIDAATAKKTTAAIDDRMKTAILALYRSAANVSQDWPQLEKAAAPGLVLWGADDPFVTIDFGKRLARRNKAKFEPFEGCGHWFPLQRPEETAKALARHWG